MAVDQVKKKGRSMFAQQQKHSPLLNTILNLAAALSLDDMLMK